MWGGQSDLERAWRSPNLTGPDMLEPGPTRHLEDVAVAFISVTKSTFMNGPNINNKNAMANIFKHTERDNSGSIGVDSAGQWRAGAATNA